MVALWTGYLCIAKGVVYSAISAMVRTAPVDAWLSIWNMRSYHQADASGVMFFAYLEGAGRWGQEGGLLCLVSRKYQASVVPPHLRKQSILRLIFLFVIPTVTRHLTHTQTWSRPAATGQCVE